MNDSRVVTPISIGMSENCWFDQPSGHLPIEDHKRDGSCDENIVVYCCGEFFFAQSFMKDLIEHAAMEHC
jgi:hypothetical protein